MTHWTEDDLTHWIYGLKDDASHLDHCLECRRRADLVAAKKRLATAEPEVHWEFLAAQRRSIYRRIGKPLYNWVPVKWAASVAMVALIAGASLTYVNTEGTHAPQSLTSPGDDKLFSELVSIEQSNEPRAIKPIHSLFEQ